MLFLMPTQQHQITKGISDNDWRDVKLSLVIDKCPMSKSAPFKTQPSRRPWKHTTLQAILPGNLCSCAADAVACWLGTDDLRPSISHHGACHKVVGLSFSPSYVRSVRIQLSVLTGSKEPIISYGKIRLYNGNTDLPRCETLGFHRGDLFDVCWMCLHDV